jgi:hypothetical protein
MRPEPSIVLRIAYQRIGRSFLTASFLRTASNFRLREKPLSVRRAVEPRVDSDVSRSEVKPERGFR